MRLSRSSIFLLSLPLAFACGCKHDLKKEALNVPIAYTYTRQDAPDLKIPVRTSTSSGLKKDELEAIKDVLDKLPVEHLRVIKTIAGYPARLPKAADGKDMAGGVALLHDGIIIIRTDIGRQILLRPTNLPRLVMSDGTSNYANIKKTLVHEIGHLVQSRMISANEQQQWNTLSSQSRYTTDTVSEYAETNSGEDFADSYEFWTEDTEGFAFDAVYAAINGHSLLLQKLLVMAALFANGDGTMNFFSMGEKPETAMIDDPLPFNPNSRSGRLVLDGPLSVRRVAYQLTEDILAFGNYAFRLAGRHIQAILDVNGKTIAQGLSIPVADMVFDRLHTTATKAVGTESLKPPPLSVTDAVEIISPATSGGPIPQGAEQVISLHPPTNYVSLNSSDGYAALSAEQAFIRNPEKPITTADAVRPHGNFQVVPPTPSIP